MRNRSNAQHQTPTIRDLTTLTIKTRSATARHHPSGLLVHWLAEALGREPANVTNVVSMGVWAGRSRTSDTMTVNCTVAPPGTPSASSPAQEAMREHHGRAPRRRTRQRPIHAPTCRHHPAHTRQNSTQQQQRFGDVLAHPQESPAKTKRGVLEYGGGRCAPASPYAYCGARVMIACCPFLIFSSPLSRPSGSSPSPTVMLFSIGPMNTSPGPDSATAGSTLPSIVRLTCPGVSPVSSSRYASAPPRLLVSACCVLRFGCRDLRLAAGLGSRG